MPSQPAADSPFAASLLQREMGPRQPGTPSVAGKPSPQAAGVKPPNQPGVNTAQPGKPPVNTGPMPAQPMAPPAPTPQPGFGAMAPVPPDPTTVVAQQALQTRQKLGPMPKVFSGIPGMPQLPVIPGRWNYNPFTGQWSK